MVTCGAARSDMISRFAFSSDLCRTHSDLANPLRHVKMKTRSCPSVHVSSLFDKMPRQAAALESARVMKSVSVVRLLMAVTSCPWSLVIPSLENMDQERHRVM